MPITKGAHLCKPERYSWLINNFTCIAAIARANQPEALPMKWLFQSRLLPIPFFLLCQVDIPTQQISISRGSIQPDRFLQINQRQIFVFHLTFHVGTGNIKSRIVRSSRNILFKISRASRNFPSFCSKVANPSRPL